MSIEKIFYAQKEFFNSDATISVNFRIINLTKLKKELLKNEYEIYTALHKDLGKSEEDSFVSEFSHCINEINYFIKNLRSLSKPKRVRTSIINFKSKAYIHKKPYGVCLIISCWNYPLYISLMPLIGALASGNTCILKLHTLNPNTNKLIEKIIKEVFEKCYVFTISKDEYEINKLLDLDFDYIFATGNPNFGKLVYEKASKNLIPVTLELGGKNPCIVHSDCEIDTSCKRIIHGKFLNSGQTCLAPDILYVNSKIKDKFIDRMIFYIKDLYSENPLNFKHYSKIINESHFLRLIKIIEDNREEIIFGGEYSKDKLKISPTLIDKEEIIPHEIFGPILQIKYYDILDGLIHSLKCSPPPLALYLFTSNKTIINRFLNIHFGGGCINDTLVHICENNLPFGGIKNSGIGYYHRKYSFDTFTYNKSLLIKSNKIDIKSRYPNNKNYNLKFLKLLLKNK
ncbi:aldehyde dehydrogenase family protein [Candidatus Arthromitus sp. SFB-rat-Yit]|uniref:aldehyde dehydrogenase family protein n=1 Tax=Candidatus Arthromitus sp. SFB-rat-Yit TaxID=1041504 RepID=UPI000227A053|nr:aldehyde dehydrogenase family protein [Candidatus Arthromitus sp. SFB-rat-Yit]BAK80727.1 aldehyde dehydrogenase ywdH [Candidatus Arthromitus sp. SFB-rat-Yit]